MYPGATFVADPTSSVVLPSPAPGEPSPLPGGPGYGIGYQGSLSYDHAQSKWLPVPFQWVSPDGSRYAYPSTNSIYVQDVADSAHVQLGAGHTWNIVAVLAEGVYASDPNAAGLWLLPYSGSPHQVTSNGYWRAAAAGAAYGTATSAVPQGASSAIIKLDLQTGAISDWFGRSNSQAYPVGFDARGHPVIQVNYNGDGSELWLTTAPSTGTPIGGAGGSYYQSPNLYGTPFGDSHGVWIPGSVPGNNGSGIALFVPGSGIYWMANIGGQLAGPCI